MNEITAFSSEQRDLLLEVVSTRLPTVLDSMRAMLEGHSIPRDDPDAACETLAVEVANFGINASGKSLPMGAKLGALVDLLSQRLVVSEGAPTFPSERAALQIRERSLRVRECLAGLFVWY